MDNSYEEGFTLSDQMIERTLDVMKRYEFDKVRLFCNKKLNIKSLAPAFALRDFLRFINVDVEIIVENTKHIPEEFTGVLTELDCKRYLAISVDCQKETDIENDYYRESTTLLNVYSPMSTKGFGVLNFKRDDVSGTSEYLVGEFLNYCKENNLEIPESVIEWLYLGIIGATRRFGVNIKKNTMMVAKQLIDMGVDYAKVNYIYEKHDLRTVRVQEVILNNMVEKEHYLYAIIKLDEYEGKFNNYDFSKALNLFKNISGCYIAAAFVEQPDQTYKFLLRTNDYYKANVKLVARKNNGNGDDQLGVAVIQPFDIDKAIEDIKLACLKIEAKEEKQV